METDNTKMRWASALSSIVLAFIFLLLIISQTYSFMSPETQDDQASRPPPPKGEFFRGMPKESPFMLTFFIFGFIVSTFASMMMYSSIHKDQKKQIKSAVLNEMLLPEEKLIIKLIEENGGKMTQSELVKKSNLSKLKVSRILKKLESSNIVKKYPHGLTNSIKLQTENIN